MRVDPVRFRVEPRFVMSEKLEQMTTEEVPGFDLGASDSKSVSLVSTILVLAAFMFAFDHKFNDPLNMTCANSMEY
jgi:hypothetical protein